MSYFFTFLVMSNIVFFGYFVLIHDDNVDLSKEEISLTQPISFENTSKHVEPLIGTKK